MASLQQPPEMLHLCVAAGGAQRSLHGAVIPQQPQRGPDQRTVEESQPRATGTFCLL